MTGGYVRAALCNQLPLSAQHNLVFHSTSGRCRAGAAEAIKILALERDVANLTRELAAQRTAASDDARLWARRLAEEEARGAKLADENESLLAELQARPSLQDHRCVLQLVCRTCDVSLHSVVRCLYMRRLAEEEVRGAKLAEEIENLQDHRCGAALLRCFERSSAFVLLSVAQRRPSLQGRRCGAALISAAKRCC